MEKKKELKKTLQEVKKLITKNPKQNDMSWVHNFDKLLTPDNRDELLMDCKTTHCIAGWMEIANEDLHKFIIKGKTGVIEGTRNYFDCNFSSLFFVMHWTEDNEKLYDSNPVKAMKKEIDHFIKEHKL